MNKIQDIFCENLKTLRGLRKWTQQAVADKIGLSLRGYQDVEYAKNFPSHPTIIALAKAFDVEEWVLFSAAIEKAGFLSKMPRDLLLMLDEMYLRGDETQIRAIESVLRAIKPEVPAQSGKVQILIEGLQKLSDFDLDRIQEEVNTRLELTEPAEKKKPKVRGKAG